VNRARKKKEGGKKQTYDEPSYQDKESYHSLAGRKEKRKKEEGKEGRKKEKRKKKKEEETEKGLRTRSG